MGGRATLRGLAICLALVVGGSFGAQALANAGGGFKPTAAPAAKPLPTAPSPGTAAPQPSPPPVVAASQPVAQPGQGPQPPAAPPRIRKIECPSVQGYGVRLSFCNVELRPTTIYLAAGLASLLLTLIPVYPIYAFYRRGWYAKRDDIMSSFSDEAKQIYLQVFRLKTLDKAAASVEFDQMYVRRYGRYRLRFPIAALLLVSMPILFLFVETGITHLTMASDGKMVLVGLLRANNQQLPALPAAAAAAIAGAYLWTVLTLISGASRANMPPGVILTAAARLVISAPLGYAVAGLGLHVAGPFLAFAFSSFPLDQVQSLTRQLVSKYLNVDLSQTESDDRVTVIDGIDRETAVRLADADITTSPQLAYCDPVQVSMQTNINFDAIVDGQNQALLRLYLGADGVKVRPMGLRGAMEVRTLVQQMASTTPAISGPANATFAVAAAAMAIPPEGFARALDEVAEDPYTKFLANVWAGDTPVESEPALAAAA
jgi:hypothetical protein